MSTRHAQLCKWIERDWHGKGDHELYCELHVTVVHDRGDRWTPEYYGIEPEKLYVDGEEVAMDAHDEIVQELLQEPVPPDEGPDPDDARDTRIERERIDREFFL